MSTASIDISREGTRERGRYVARMAGVAGESELTYRQIAPGVISADHTGAPLSMRGTGAARALVEHLVREARSEGFRVHPRCSYVALLFDRHPEWADVRSA